MRFLIVAIRDRAADVYGQPFFVASLGQAVRSFGDEVNRQAENNNLYAHPEDFDLFNLGVYDDASGQFENVSPPRQIAVGKDFSARLKSN